MTAHKELEQWEIGSGNPVTPRQIRNRKPVGFPMDLWQRLTKGGVAGQNPATKIKQHTVQLPMKLKIAAQTAQKSTDGRYQAIGKGSGVRHSAFKANHLHLGGIR